MKVLVLGSGLLGVSTAYELGKRGFDVTVLERNVESARETSFANGGQLSYTHAEPWACPSSLRKLPKWLFRSDSPLVFRLRADLPMMRWGIMFLRNCTEARAPVNCVNLLRLNLYSRDALEKIRKETNIAFDYSSAGILQIFGAEKDFDHMKSHYEFQAKFGSESKILSGEECLALETSLSYTPRKIIGGIHTTLDELGDPYLYCQALAKIAAERYGVKFCYDITIKKIHTQNQVITGVSTSQGDCSADAYVMAMGSYSTLALRKIGIEVPIYPMKGYSLTLPADEFSPSLSVTDGSHKIVYTRLGNRLRVAGTAEFAGYSQSINKRRIKPIIKSSKELFPKINWDQKNLEKWACIRPSTPDGPPILGRSPIKNLILNTGHGTLGWTQAAGSAAIVADIMEGKPAGIILPGLTLERFI